MDEISQKFGANMKKIREAKKSRKVIFVALLRSTEHISAI